MTVGAGVIVLAAFGGVAVHRATADPGDLIIENYSTSAVNVLVNGSVTNIAAGDIAEILDIDCTKGDVDVTPDSGETKTVRGPVCSDHKIVIARDAITLEVVTAEDQG